MNHIDLLMELVEDEGIEIYEMPFSKRIKALYSDNVIAINTSVVTTAEYCSIIAEELGHHFTSNGNILNLKNMESHKQEIKARRWAQERLISFDSLIAAASYGVSSQFELAEYLGVTESFLNEALDQLKARYGTFYKHGQFVIYFDPLGVLELM